MYEKKNHDPNAANYLNSLSLTIRNLKTLNSDQVSFIQRLSIYCFNDFVCTEPKSEFQKNISNAIIISIYCVASSHAHILDNYLKQLCKITYFNFIKHN